MNPVLFFSDFDAVALRFFLIYVVKCVNLHYDAGANWRCVVDNCNERIRTFRVQHGPGGLQKTWDAGTTIVYGRHGLLTRRIYYSE